MRKTGVSKRKREAAVLSFEESERRALLHKDWTRYKTRQHRDEMLVVARLRGSQQRALDELRSESEELYQSAIQVGHSETTLSMHTECNGMTTRVSNKWSEWVITPGHFTIR